MLWQISVRSAPKEGFRIVHAPRCLAVLALVAGKLVGVATEMQLFLERVLVRLIIMRGIDWLLTSATGQGKQHDYHHGRFFHNQYLPERYKIIDPTIIQAVMNMANVKPL